MAITILYQNNVTGAAHDVTTLITAAKWTTKRSGSPASLTVTAIVDDAVAWNPGGILVLKNGSTGLFYGYVVKISQSEKDQVQITAYRRNFNSSSKAIRIGTAYKIDVFNNLDYAKPLEYGFRGHFVPGHWDGKSFVYQPKDPQGGMFVHSLIPGHYTLERAVNATKRTQDARLQRRFEQELKKRGYMKYFK